MPILIISTNSTKSIATNDLEALNWRFAKAVREKESICSVAINRNSDQIFGRKEGNCALVNFTLETDLSNQGLPSNYVEKYLSRNSVNKEISNNLKRPISHLFDVPEERIVFGFF